jgi:hypothetical protein
MAAIKQPVFIRLRPNSRMHPSVLHIPDRVFLMEPRLHPGPWRPRRVACHHLVPRSMARKLSKLLCHMPGTKLALPSAILAGRGLQLTMRSPA